MASNPMLPPGMAPNPAWLAPPQAQGPGLGFRLWAQDPLNNMKVQHSLSAPDQPLQPGAGQPPMAAVTPPAQAPMAAVNPPQQPAPVNLGSLSTPPPGDQAKLGTDQAELARLQNTGSGASQVKNPFLRALAKIGDVAGTILAPGAMLGMPGSTIHNMLLQKQERGNVAGDQAAIKATNDAADTQSQVAQRNAAAAKSGALADADEPFTLTPLQAQAIGHPELSGTQATMRDYNRVLYGADKNTAATTNNQNTNATRVTTTGMNNATSTANNKNTNDTHESIAAAANKTRTLVAAMHDATSRANNADTNANKGKTTTGTYKVPADVTKRAALANNVTENADAVDALVGKRPDLVGAAGGRYTSVQQMIGSNDPDIAEMGVRMHNIALASNGAHGVRAQQAIGQTEKELFNDFKTGPQGVHSALNATRSSMQTFLDDERNYSTTGKRTGNNMVPPPSQPQSNSPTPNTHTFSLGAWQRANPKGDVNAARAAAQQQKFTVVP